MNKAIVLAVVLVSITSLAFAGVETVKDDNDGNKGYILINAGTKNGNSDVGHWTDITTIPELKGDKGDKGDIGITGQNGKDVDPTTVTNLQNADTTEETTRTKADTQLQSNTNQVNNSVDNLSNRVSKLERTQYKVEVGVRVLDTKRLTITPYVSQNFTRGCVDEVGVRVTIKLGTSYEEREIAKTNARLDNLEKRIGTAPLLTKVVDTKGNTKSISISATGLSVTNQF
jgi:hypothetical protein